MTDAPQFIRSSTGHFVMHKLPIGAARRCSAWFLPNGDLIDAEIFDRMGRPRPIKRNGPSWHKAQDWGRAALRAFGPRQAC